jgi:hypothetical protein
MLFALKVVGAAKEWNGKRLFENASLDVSVGERSQGPGTVARVAGREIVSERRSS